MHRESPSLEDLSGSDILNSPLATCCVVCLSAGSLEAANKTLYRKIHPLAGWRGDRGQKPG